MTPLPKAPFVPVYKQLVEEYKNAIITRSLKAGQRIYSITELMRLHRISRETAKQVLKILAREGLVVQRPGKGTFVADLSPRRKLWAVVLPFYSVQYEDLVHRLSVEAWRMGRQLHHFVDYNSWREELRLVGQLIAERYEAVIVVPTLDESKTAEFYSTLSPRETHVVLIDHTMAGSFFGYVIQSYDLGVQRGVHHLLERNPGCLAFVRNETWAGRNLVQELMEETFLDVMHTERPDVQAIVVDRAARLDAPFMRETGVAGLFCCDDTDAVRIIGRLKEQGLNIPGHCGLVSYGNTDLARYFTPAISSVDPHSQELAEKAVDILRRRIEGEDTQLCQYVVQPELVVRDT